MSEQFSVQWNEFTGQLAVAKCKFPRRLVRSVQPSVRGRILSWGGRSRHSEILPEALAMLQPNVLIGLGVGGSVSCRLCGLSGKVFVPPGVGVEVALDSPLFQASTTVSASGSFRFVPGQCDFRLSDSDSGSLVDSVSLCVPVINDNAGGAGDQYSYAAVTFEQVSGYSRYELTNGTSSALHMLVRGMAAPGKGAVEQCSFASVQQLDTIDSWLLSGYAALAYEGTGYPLHQIATSSGYAGTLNVWQAGTLSFF